MLNIEADNRVSAKMIQVAVAVIIKNDRVLIAKRADHVHQGGLWEFPGGKVEPGETVSEALVREIREELGINIIKSRPLIRLRYDYPDKSVLLDVQEVSVFDGKEYFFDSVSEQLGIEDQQVKWLPLEQLESHHFPPANKAIINALKLPQSYLITPECEPAADQIEQFIEQFSNSIQYHNLRLIQLRLKSLKKKELNLLVQQLCEIAKKNNVQLLINSSLCLDEQIKYLSAGIHLTSVHLHKAFSGEDGLDQKAFINNYRQRFPGKIIAASCHTKKDIEQANYLKLDFIVLSPVQHTVSHPEQKALGWKQFKALTDIADMPVFALGGMDQNNMSQAQKNGAQGISAIRSLWRVQPMIKNGDITFG